MRVLTVLVLMGLFLSACDEAPKKKPRKKKRPKAPVPTSVEIPRAAAPVLAKDKKRVKLVFGGDLSLARGMLKVTDRDGAKDPAYMFSRMRDAIDDADLLFANVEMVLADSHAGEARQKKWRIKAPTRQARGLKKVGMDVVSVANNHIHDFGAQGIRATLKALHKNGIAVTGVEWKEGEGQSVAQATVGELTVGFLAYNTHGDEYRHAAWYPRVMPLNRQVMLAEVKAAAAKFDVLVVSMHWGGELDLKPYPSTLNDAKNLAAAGADIIVGSGPHVAQHFDVVDGAIVAYSLGDMIFDKSTPWIRHRTDIRFLLEVEYEGKARVAWRAVPMRMGQDWRPFVAKDVNVEAFSKPPTPFAYRLSDDIKVAAIYRRDDDDNIHCRDWTTKRARWKRGHYLRWVRPRWVCPLGDPDVPYSIAGIYELSGGELRPAIFASPHDSGETILVFKGVPTEHGLAGYAGVPDWPISQQGDDDVDPIEVDVFINDKKRGTHRHPYGPGWKPFEIDTTGLSGNVEIRVEIRGGKGKKEPGFLFEIHSKNKRS